MYLETKEPIQLVIDETGKVIADYPTFDSLTPELKGNHTQDTYNSMCLYEAELLYIHTTTINNG